jgi:SAM-dependent methyltransferase
MHRDTDQDWIKIGETDPYFGVAGDPRYHLARVDDDRLDELYRGGDSEINAVIRTIRSFVPNFAAADALDFGCGVGRHTFAMAAHAEMVTGFDIAPGMTARAAAAASRRGVANCRFVNALSAEERFDWINSYQVFQHIIPDRGYRIVADLFDRLRFDGICSLQFTLFRRRRHVHLEAGALWRFDGSNANALVGKSLEGVGQIILFDYDLNQILAQMIAHRLELLAVKTTEYGGHHGIWVFGRKRPQGLLLRPGRRYRAHEAPSFEEFLGEGWSELEDWGVWSSGRIATLRLCVPPGLEDDHVLKLYGKAFVNPQHPYIVIDAFVNSQPTVRREFAEPGDDEILEIPLQAAYQDGMATIRLEIDSPISPTACGLPVDDNRDLGFGLKAVSLESR